MLNGIETYSIWCCPVYDPGMILSLIIVSEHMDNTQFTVLEAVWRLATVWLAVIASRIIIAVD